MNTSMKVIFATALSFAVVWAALAATGALERMHFARLQSEICAKDDSGYCTLRLSEQKVEALAGQPDEKAGVADILHRLGIQDPRIEFASSPDESRLELIYHGRLQDMWVSLHDGICDQLNIVPRGSHPHFGL